MTQRYIEYQSGEAGPGDYRSRRGRIEVCLWAALLVLALVLRLFGLGERAMSHDESLHAYYSYHFSETGSYSHDPMMHGPLLFHLGAASFAFFGDNDFTARLAPALAGVLAVAALWLFRGWLGRRGAFFAALFLALSPLCLFYSRYIRNDAYMLLFNLVWIWGVFRYRRTRDNSHLWVVCLAMAAAFVCKETAFLFGSLMGGYLLFSALAARFSGRLVEQGALVESPDMHLAAFMFMAVLPFASPLLHLALGYDPLGYDTPQGLARSLVLIGGCMVLGLILAWAWFGGLARKGPGFGRVALMLLSFWGIIALLYSTFLSNAPTGLATGFTGSMGYWLAQHGVQRGGQPWFYYILLLGLYEFLPLILALVGVLSRILRRSNLAGSLSPFLVWWAVGSLLLYSVAGEKMPWLTVHISQPLCLLAGVFIGGLGIRGRGGVVKALFLAGLLFLSGREAWLMNFVHPELPVEIGVYAHGTPDIKKGLAALDQAAELSGKGRDFSVAVDDGAAWPLAWYLRKYPNRTYFQGVPGEFELGYEAIFIEPKNQGEHVPELEQGRKAMKLRAMWWPLENYKKWTRADVTQALTTKQGLARLVDYFIHRTPRPGAELEAWPLKRDVLLYLPVNATKVE